MEQRDVATWRQVPRLALVALVRCEEDGAEGGGATAALDSSYHTIQYGTMEES